MSWAEDHTDPVELKRLLKGAFIVVDGEGFIRLDDRDSVFIGIVFNVQSMGPHTAAIAVDQNRFHASGNSVLETAWEILEQYEHEHNQDYYEELVKEYGEDEVMNNGMFTETFDGLVWRLSPEDVIAALEGTDAIKFLDVDYDIEEDYEE